MEYPRFVNRLRAAAYRQLLAIDATAIGTGGAGEAGAMRMTFLQTEAHGD